MWSIISVSSVRLSLCQFIFAHLVYVHTIRVKFICEGHRVKVKVTGPKKPHNRYSRNGLMHESASAQCKDSISNNSASITHTAVKCTYSIGFFYIWLIEWHDCHLSYITRINYVQLNARIHGWSCLRFESNLVLIVIGVAAALF